jgi:hypothetical protein
MTSSPQPPKQFEVRFFLQEPEYCTDEQARQVVGHMLRGYSTSGLEVNEFGVIGIPCRAPGVPAQV